MQTEFKIKENLARNLARLREEKELTQTELADSLKRDYHVAITRSNVAAYETQAAVPKIEALHAYACFFDRSVDYLISDPRQPREEVYVMEKTLKQWREQYSEALDGYRFYKTLCGRMLREVQNADEEAEQGKPYRPMMEKLRKVHANMLMERDPVWKAYLRENLTERERQVYEASNAGESLHTLCKKMNTDENEVFSLLGDANAKIGKYIDDLSL